MASLVERPTMTRIITIKSPKVKPTRNTPHPTTRFGAGILATRPAYSVPFALSDEQWYVEQLAAAEDCHYDEMEADAIALARVDMGLCF